MSGKCVKLENGALKLRKISISQLHYFNSLQTFHSVEAEWKISSKHHKALAQLPDDPAYILASLATLLLTYNSRVLYVLFFIPVRLMLKEKQRAK